MGHPLVLGMPHTRGRYRLAHGGDSLEDNTAHERDAHAEAGEGKRAVHAHLDATSIESHGEDGKDRTDCEAGDAHAIEGGLGVGVGVHVEILSVGRSSFDNKDIRGLTAFCIYELISPQIRHNHVVNMNCPIHAPCPARLP